MHSIWNMDTCNILIVFLGGLVGSSFGTLAGGAGLITIPLLIILGLSPQAAVAANRLGNTGLALTGLYEFNRKGLVDYKIGTVLSIGAMAGAYIGANLVVGLNEALLKQIIAVVTVLTLAVLYLKPESGLLRKEIKSPARAWTFGMAGSFLAGVYSGFHGAGAGTLYTYLLIFTFGQTFLESTATRKIIGLLLSITATAVFIHRGVMHYTFGITLFFAMSAGSYIGAYYSVRLGNLWIKRLFTATVLVMVIKLFI